MALPIHLIVTVMGTLGQCVDILNLTSFDWKRNRGAVVAHSFRVMSMARNYDEMVVGIMHHVYASSSYARGLFACDVDYECEWKEALDLFVEKRPKLKAKSGDEVPCDVLLGLNMDQSLKSEDGKVDEWMSHECKWSPNYRKKLERIGSNRIARNVMIYDLEDKLEILTHPERFEEDGTETLALPWKIEYLVDVCIGRHFKYHTRIPEDDDNLLSRPLTNRERADLVEKYSRALVMLRRLEYEDGPRDEDFSEDEFKKNSLACKRWYDGWLADEMAMEEIYGDEDEEEL